MSQCELLVSKCHPPPSQRIQHTKTTPFTHHHHFTHFPRAEHRLWKYLQPYRVPDTSTLYSAAKLDLATGWLDGRYKKYKHPETNAKPETTA